MNAVHEKARRLKTALALVLAILSTACGSSSKSSTSTSGPVAGNWQMTMQPGDGNPEVKTESGFLQQSGNVVTGSVSVFDSPCSGVGSVTGTVNGMAVSLVVAPVGIQIGLTGTLGSDQASMSGTYTVITTGCSGRQTAPQSGTWTGNLVQPLNGNINGSFVSTRFGTIYAIGGNVSQGPNTGASNTTLTGTLSGPSGYCFASVNIAGVISGTETVWNLLDSNGNQIGTVTGTSSFDGTSVTGKYVILSQGRGNPCPAGDLGTVTLSL